jgi:hypothetical protein
MREEYEGNRGGKMNRTSIVLLLLSLTMILPGTTPSEAMSSPEPPLPKALAAADLVVHALLESTTSAWAEDQWGRHIWTTYNLRVLRTIKGSPAGEKLTLRILGGTVGDQTELVFDIPRPYPLQEAVYLLSARHPGGPLAMERSLPVVGGWVRLGAKEVPLDQFAEAVQQLTKGDATHLQALLPLPRLSVRPAPPGDSGEQKLRVPVAEARPVRSRAKILQYAEIYDARWENGVDNDGDGYFQAFDLLWDADVSDGVSSLTVMVDVYSRVSGATDWNLLGTVGPHVITGFASADVFGVTITGEGAPTTFENAIAVYRQGAQEYDHVLYPEDDPDLAGVPFEGASEDGGGGPAPTITSVTPARAAAGTGDQVTITGTGFGSTRGEVRFLFQFGDQGYDTVSADISSWSDTRITCTVPICRAAQGECGGYPGGSSSGPVWVLTAQGGQSSPAAFEVPFGYGGQKWDPAQVPYQIATSVPAGFRTAIENAFATWTAAAGVTFTYSGSTNASTTSNNGITELTYGPLPDGVPEGVIAFANCWPAAEIINECDVQFNSAMPWSTSTPTPASGMDVESIALHEFGHWLVLLDLYGNEQGYSSDIDKVMFGTSSTGPDWTKRELHPDDVLGVQWIYPGGGTSCSYSISPGSASVGAAGGTGSVTVNTTSGCTWTALSSAAWISVTSGSSGSGKGTVSYSVAASSGGTRSGSLTIAGKTFTVAQSGGGGTTACAYSYWIPVVARAAGAGGSSWRSDVGYVNTGSANAAIEIRAYTGSTTLTRSSSLAAGATTITRDILSWLQAGYSGSASLEVCSSQPLAIVARVYTQEASGATYGQAFAGLSEGKTLSVGQTVLLPMLTQNGSVGTPGTYRTNIGIVNASSASATVTTRLYDESGNQVGPVLTKTLGPGQKHQYNEPFSTAGRNNIAAGYAVVSVTSGSGVYAYGSVLDNGSSDPTTIGPQ